MLTIESSFTSPGRVCSHAKLVKYCDANEGVINREPKIFKYDVDEAATWMVRTKHWGPWELETISGY